MWELMHEKTLHPTFVWLARSGMFFYKVVWMIKVRAGGSKSCFFFFLFSSSLFGLLVSPLMIYSCLAFFPPLFSCHWLDYLMTMWIIHPGVIHLSQLYGAPFQGTQKHHGSLLSSWQIIEAYQNGQQVDDSQAGLLWR